VAALTVGFSCVVQILYDVRYAYLSVVRWPRCFLVEGTAVRKGTFTKATPRIAALVFAVVVVGSMYWIVPTALTSVSAPGRDTDSAGGVRPITSSFDILHSFALFFSLLPPHVSTIRSGISGGVAVRALGFARRVGPSLGSPADGSNVALLWIFGVIFASGSSVFGV